MSSENKEENQSKDQKGQFESNLKEIKNLIHFLSHNCENSNENCTNVSGSSKNETNGECDSFEKKLVNIGEEIYSSGHSCAKILAGLVIESVVVSDDFIGFLLDDGRVARLGYRFQPSSSSTTIAANQQQSSNRNNNKHQKSSSSNTISGSGSVGGGGSVNNCFGGTSSSSSSSSSFRNSSIASRNNLASSAAAAFIMPTNSSSPSEMVSRASAVAAAAAASSRRGAAHLMRAAAAGRGIGGSGGGAGGINTSVIVTHGRMLPVSAVPESLIESVQTVLQSKSRTVIVRELQRTNLDVNLAVNNLLQRDDEADEPPTDTDDDETIDAAAYMHGDDLISLLDINNATQSNNNNQDLSSSSSSISDNHRHNHHHHHHHHDADVSFRLAAARRFVSAPISKQSSAYSGTYRLRDHRWFVLSFYNHVTPILNFRTIIIHNNKMK
jgi:hypothetical protein